GGTGMAQVGRNAEVLVAENQKYGDGESHQWAGDIPRPRLFQPFNHKRQLIFSFNTFHAPPLYTSHPASASMVLAIPLRLPLLQQVTMGLFFFFSSTARTEILSNGMLMLPVMCPPANSPGVRTSMI